jgi:hypothetical protein
VQFVKEFIKEGEEPGLSGSAFDGLLKPEPDPHCECGSGSRRRKISPKKRRKIKSDDQNKI